MTEHSTFQPGDKVVALSSLTRSAGIASAVAAVTCYQVVYGVADFLTTLIFFVPAVIIGVIAGRILSMRFNSGGRAGATTIVKHGREGVPVTIRTALTVAAVISIIFILIAIFGLGFDGNLIALIATIALPALLVATVWALLGSLF